MYCPTSYFSPHRKFKCFLNTVILNNNSDTDYIISDDSDSDDSDGDY